MKLVLILALFSVVAIQETTALWRRGGPGPIGLRPHRRLPEYRKDVTGDLDANDDGYLDQTEFAKFLNERDVQEFMEYLDENEDNLVSVDEFADKN